MTMAKRFLTKKVMVHASALRLPVRDLAKVRAAAADEGISVSQFTRDALRRAVRRRARERSAGEEAGV